MLFNFQSAVLAVTLAVPANLPSQDLSAALHLAQLRPGGAQFDPIEKPMCTWAKKLYAVGTELRINGKTYICTLIDPPEGLTRWALSPVQ